MSYKQKIIVTEKSQMPMKNHLKLVFFKGLFLAIDPMISLYEARNQFFEQFYTREVSILLI